VKGGFIILPALILHGKQNLVIITKKKENRVEYGKFIEIKKEDAQKFMFIGKGVSDDETRYFLNHAFCAENKLISTDGRRLHILELRDNPHGFKDKTYYRVLKMNTKIVWIVEITSDVGQFPDTWKRVIPKGDHKKIYFEMKSGRYGIGANYINIAKLIREIPTDYAINFAFLEDLMKNVDWEVHIFEDNKAIKFIYKDLTAIIMPLDAT